MLRIEVIILIDVKQGLKGFFPSPCIDLDTMASRQLEKWALYAITLAFTLFLDMVHQTYIRRQSLCCIYIQLCDS
jgi:hypothetical protein